MSLLSTWHLQEDLPAGRWLSRLWLHHRLRLRSGQGWVQLKGRSKGRTTFLTLNDVDQDTVHLDLPSWTSEAREDAPRLMESKGGCQALRKPPGYRAGHRSPGPGNLR